MRAALAHLGKFDARARDMAPGSEFLRWLNQETLVQKIIEAVKEERIKDISDARNESGREAQSRVVVELKRGADPAVVENQLYQFTPLQITFSIHNIALVNRQPRTLSLIEMIRSARPGGTDL